MHIPLRHHPDLRWVIVVTAVATAIVTSLIFWMTPRFVVPVTAPTVPVITTTGFSDTEALQTEITNLKTIVDQLNQQIKLMQAHVATSSTATTASTSIITEKG